MSRPTTNVGIVAMDCYFPAAYVSQAELETANNVSQGKATRLFFLNNGKLLPPFSSPFDSSQLSYAPLPPPACLRHRKVHHRARAGELLEEREDRGESGDRMSTTPCTGWGWGVV